MTVYNRTLLSEDEFVSVKPYLQLAFREFTPRSHFIKDNKAVEKHNHEALDINEQPNLVSFPTISYPHAVPGIASFHELFSPCPVYELLNEKFQWVNQYVAERVIEVKTTFITFSTDITEAKIGVKHLHAMYGVLLSLYISIPILIYMLSFGIIIKLTYSPQDIM